ncbi:hypothetical protein Tco_1105911 [Tanacetum coccineum]
MYNDGLLDEILEDLWKKAYNEPELAKDFDEDLSSDEEIVLMGDVNFSNTDDDCDTSSAKEQPRVHQLQPLRCYRKIYTTGCVLFLRALNALVDQFVKKPIKSKIKLTNCILALRAPNTLDVGSSSQKRESK